MDVPCTAGAGCTSPNCPFKMDISDPSSLPFADKTLTSDTDAMLASASPLNPKVSILNKSSTDPILLVL